MNHKVAERISRLQEMYLQLRFSPKAAKLLIGEIGLDRPQRLSPHKQEC